jgi:hypothetical protein
VETEDKVDLMVVEVILEEMEVLEVLVEVEHPEIVAVLEVEVILAAQLCLCKHL